MYSSCQHVFKILHINVCALKLSSLCNKTENTTRSMNITHVILYINVLTFPSVYEITIEIARSWAIAKS